MIHKLTDEKEFAKFSNEVARDKKLTLQAKGLLMTLLSLPPDWVIHKKQLNQFSKNGRDSVVKAFNELMKEGFIEKVVKGKTVGKFKNYEFDVYPKRQIRNSPPHNRRTENQSPDNPSPENPFL